MESDNNNSSSNTTQAPSGIFLPENTAIVVAYFLVSLLAVPANGLVILVIAKVKAMHTPTSIVLLNLCVADLLIALFYLPFMTTDLYIKGYWVFGEFLCRLVPFLHSVAVSASILFLITIAVERYCRVCLQGRWQLTIKSTWIILAVLWLVAALAACPMLIFRHLTTLQEFPSSPVCVETWPWEHAVKVYTLVMFTLFYLIPLIFLVIVYLKIALKLWRSTTRTRSMRLSKRRASASANSKLTRISLALVLSFAFSWAPSQALLLWYYLRPETSYPDEVDAVLHPMFSWIASSNCALNPLLYCFMSHNFRTSFRELWKRSSRFRFSDTEGAESKLSKRQSKELEKINTDLREAEKIEMMAFVQYQSSV